MYKIGIIGLGLMGGSLAKSFSKVKEVEKIVGYDTDVESLKRAMEEKAIDDMTYDINDKFNDLDFIFICTPVSTIYEYGKKLKNIVKKDSIISDIGSTKKYIVEQIDTLNLNFVGGHPMIGSEKNGYEFSNGDLYTNSYYILTKTNKTKLDNIEKMKDLLKKINTIPLEIDLDKHDFSVGVVSHVPHIVASGLVNLVERLDDKNRNMKTIAAGGFKDITRIASANPYMWQNICQQNKEQIVLILDEFQKIINEFKDNLNSNEEVYKYFKSAKQYRDSFRTTHEIDYVTIEAKDNVGVLANIATICSNNSINIKNIKLLRTKEKNEVIINILFENEKDREISIELLKENKYKVLE